MRTKIITLLFAIIAQHAIAQNTIFSGRDVWGNSKLLFADDYLYPEDVLDNETVRIYYNMTIHLDNMSVNPQDNWILQVGPHYSRFLTEAHFMADSVLRTNDRAYAQLSRIRERSLFPFNHDCYYIDRNTGSLEFTGRLAADDFSYIEAVPVINWRIIDSTKIICGFDCKKAIGDYGGRSFEVYYTESLPSPVGPWKLGGLPGVILSAEDAGGTYSFLAFKIVNGHRFNIVRPRYPYVNVRKKEYNRMLVQAQTHYIRFVNQHISRSGVMKINEGEAEADQTVLPLMEEN